MPASTICASSPTSSATAYHGLLLSTSSSPEDFGIKKIEDLKGKVLATNLIGTGVDIAMKAGLKKHGLLDKRDYTVIEAPFPTMGSAIVTVASVEGSMGVPS